MNRYFHKFGKEKTSLKPRQLSIVYFQMVGTLRSVFVNILFYFQRASPLSFYN